MNILVDMNLSPQWCRRLATHGHECVHWSKVGEPTATDATVMLWAVKNDHVVLTHDLDFGAILASTRAAAPSVIQVRTQDVLPAAMEGLLADVLRRYEAELTAGALIIVDEANLRVRILPLSR
jgi:predicted nuclease of predicted toxin-antitoxin system